MLDMEEKITLRIRKDDILLIDNKAHVVTMELNDTQLLLMSFDTGKLQPYTQRDLELLLEQKRLGKPASDRGKPKKVIKTNVDNIGPEEEATSRVQNARAVQHQVKAWDADPNSSLSNKYLDLLVSKTAAELVSLGLPQGVRRSQLRDALSKGHRGYRPLQLFLSNRGRFKSSAFDEDYVRCMNLAVAYYWARLEHSKLGAVAELNRLVGETNKVRARNGLEPLELPSQKYETLRRWIEESTSYENYARKFGADSARRHLKGVEPHIGSKILGEVMIIDFTLMDKVFLIDHESGLPLGRLTLGRAIEVSTRSEAGFVISAEAPGVHLLMTLLDRAIRPKSYVKERYPHIQNTWNVHGKPRVVVLDSALENRLRAGADALEDLGIEVIFAPIHNPEFKSIMERGFKTINDVLLHRLSNGIPHDPKTMSRLGLRPSVDIVHSIEDAEEMLHECIIDTLQQRFHEGIEDVPAKAWAAGARKHGIDILEDPNAFATLGAVQTDRQLTRAGIKYDNHVFHDPKLTTELLASMLPRAPAKHQSKKIDASGRVNGVKFKYNPADASYIDVWDDVRRIYVRLPNRDDRYAKGLSFAACQQIKAFAKASGLEYSSESSRLEARSRLYTRWGVVVESSRHRTERRKALRFLAQEEEARLADGHAVEATASAGPNLPGPHQVPTEAMAQHRRSSNPDAVSRRNGKQADQTRKKNDAIDRKLKDLEAKPAKPKPSKPAAKLPNASSPTPTSLLNDEWDE